MVGSKVIDKEIWNVLDGDELVVTCEKVTG